MSWRWSKAVNDRWQAVLVLCSRGVFFSFDSLNLDALKSELILGHFRKHCRWLWFRGTCILAGGEWEGGVLLNRSAKVGSVWLANAFLPLTVEARLVVATVVCILQNGYIPYLSEFQTFLLINTTAEGLLGIRVTLFSGTTCTKSVKNCCRKHYSEIFLTECTVFHNQNKYDVTDIVTILSL